jgi:hypothetical protein
MIGDLKPAPPEDKPEPWPMLCPECKFPFSRPTKYFKDGRRALPGDPGSRWWLECGHCGCCTPWPPKTRTEKILWWAQGGSL